MKGEEIDTSVMSLAQLRGFMEQEIAKAKEEGVLFSAFESDDDEGIRPHYFWSCCLCIF